MREIALRDPIGSRFVPEVHNGTGVLTVAGSSGRVDAERARLLCGVGVIAESIKWFGGPGQHCEPWEIPIELFRQRVAALADECDRVVLAGASFGAEAMLITGSQDPLVDAVVAFAPSDVVWAGVRPDGVQTSHWTIEGIPIPYIALLEGYPTTDPPAFRELYRSSRERAQDSSAAEIAVERIPEVVLVAGADDQVWPSLDHAEAIEQRRARAGLATTMITDVAAGHRVVLPGERAVRAGRSMLRGGTAEADARLGRRAWPQLLRTLGV